jgi:hypothetical protein
VSITDFFKHLGAPLTNQRWSWGAVRGDKVIFLRVWQGETKKFDGVYCSMVTAHKWFAHDPDNLGHAERLRQVAAIADGARTYMIMCEAEDKNASPRVIAKFNREELFVGGKLRTIDGEQWLEHTRKAQASSLRPNTSLERTREG